MASRITTKDIKIDGFIKYALRVRTLREVSRKLVLWTTGVIPGKPQICNGCNTGSLTTRDHVVACSKMAMSFIEYTYSQEMQQENTLDAILNDSKIWR